MASRPGSPSVAGPSPAVSASDWCWCVPGPGPGGARPVEPTSAVDAHTEARIAARLRAQRQGRITVVTTTSPLVLDAVDEVAFLQGGRIVAVGRHDDLLDGVPAYRTVATRETSEVVPS